MEKPLNSSRLYFLLFIPLSLVYFYGLFVPLMDEDASHHADIALHMFVNNDYIHLISRGKDYLDKPHLHFWLSALSYHLFGVTTWAYKFPSLLVSVLGVYSTYRLGKLLYNLEAGLLAALMTASAQAFILANNDVRMDALLTGFIIFATWQLTAAVTEGRWYQYILGALGMAMAFSTKGMIGAVMPATAVLFFLLYQRNWRMIFNVRWLGVGILFFVFITPVLYSYYVQFDLHPEKLIRGRDHISGIRFILWDQNLERLEGSNWGKGKGHPFFFFHTFLWAFLPWSLLAYFVGIRRFLFFFRTRFRYVKGAEFLTTGTIVAIFFIISSANYQLPHYLNILFPFFSIWCASELLFIRQEYLDQKNRQLKALLIMQYVVAGVCSSLALFLNFWAFPVTSANLLVLTVLIALLLLAVVMRPVILFNKLLLVSVLSISLVNLLLNGNFYPQILRYQSGPALASVVRSSSQSPLPVYKFMFDSFSFDFYMGRLVPLIDVDTLERHHGNIWLYTSEEGLDQLRIRGLAPAIVQTCPNYRVTKLKAKFINPKTRFNVCDRNYLVEISAERALTDTGSTAANWMKKP